MNIDIAVKVNPEDTVSIGSIEKDPRQSRVALRGVVDRIFTTKENYKVFFHCTIKLDNGITVRVIAWSTLADYMLDQIKEGSVVEVQGFLNTTTHKIRQELSREVVASLVLIKDDE